jgi:hypothetical protein
LLKHVDSARQGLGEVSPIRHLTLLVTTLDVSGTPSVWESLGSLDDAVGSQFIAFAIAFALIAN